MFTNKYWLQISSILKSNFVVVKNLKKKDVYKGGLPACKLYKKDSQYKLAKAIFVDFIDTIIEHVSDGHMVMINDDVYFQVDYKSVNKNVGSPYNDIKKDIISDGKIPYIYFYFYGKKMKIVTSKRIKDKMIDRMGEGYRFTRKFN